LIAGTRNTRGLRVECHLDTNQYPAGVQVSDSELDQVNLRRHEFHGEWNYTILPSNCSN